jgi:hypothetical protein
MFYQSTMEIYTKLYHSPKNDGESVIPCNAFHLESTNHHRILVPNIFHTRKIKIGTILARTNARPTTPSFDLPPSPLQLC